MAHLSGIRTMGMYKHNLAQPGLALLLLFFIINSYWYNNGFLLPDLATVFIAIDKADSSNGCLKVNQLC